MFDAQKIFDALVVLYIRLPDEMYNNLEADMLSCENSTTNEFVVLHRIFRRIANQKVAMLKVFNQQWEAKPYRIVSLMSMICYGVDCDALIGEIDDKKDEINNHQYLVACNVAKTIHDYQTTKPKDMRHKYLLSQLTQ